jgi:hypothetical protein
VGDEALGRVERAILVDVDGGDDLVMVAHHAPEIIMPSHRPCKGCGAPDRSPYPGDVKLLQGVRSLR